MGAPQRVQKITVAKLYFRQNLAGVTFKVPLGLKCSKKSFKEQINHLLGEQIGQKGPPQIGLQEKYEGEALKESNDISPIFTPDDFIEFSSTY